MDIIKSEYVSFEEYKQLVDKYVALDNREINFQDRVVLQLIDRILANSDELSVVDVHAQYKNRESDLHKREFYAGDHTPDLLIARDWHYENRDKDKSDYIAIVEIKSPALDPISKDSSHTSEEMEEYFGICDKVKGYDSARIAVTERNGLYRQIKILGTREGKEYEIMPLILEDIKSTIEQVIQIQV